MFVDASAIVAILNGEPDADAFADAIEASGGGAVTSPIAVYARYGKERGHRARLNLGN
jgi:uncharacterized protein with PIN domain